MNITLKVVFVGLLLWILVAILIDKFIIQPLLPVLSSAISIELHFYWSSISFNLPQVGFFMLVCIPLIVAALILMPWFQPRNKQMWIEGFEKWSSIIIWSFIIFILTAVGELLYRAFKPIISEGLRNVVESVHLLAYIRFGLFEFAKIDVGLTAVLGLIVGCYFFMKKGIKQNLFEYSGLHKSRRWR
jgi:hypothetical protein